ncbi:hypothetical protein BVC80_8947g23 [Macleaya cordata]|uniref:Uncharacterized protein n=1 Tax=Macleaya cordata TaxID=56857 RepID=A0A200QRK5_MACCD|nr:hypothetical protein BVC80_8947g23 [Macleaya cordata]
MGLEISEEFWPITPIRTIPTTTRNYNSTINIINNDKNYRSKNSNSSNNGECQFKLPDLKNNTRELKVGEDEEEEEEEEECSTPKSEDQKLKTPLVCPPAPRKARPVKRKHGLSSSSSSSSQTYFQVPADLNSVFFSIPTSCKKIKAG